MRVWEGSGPRSMTARGLAEAAEVATRCGSHLREGCQYFPVEGDQRCTQLLGEHGELTVIRRAAACL